LLTDKKISWWSPAIAMGQCTRDVRQVDGDPPEYHAFLRNHLRERQQPDDAGELLGQLAGRDPRLTVITHSRNFGSQMAFTSGMQQAVGDAVILMDGDLQDPPEVIPSLVAEWLKASTWFTGSVSAAGKARRRRRRAGYSTACTGVSRTSKCRWMPATFRS